MFGWCWNKKLWQCNTQAASTVFPLRDVRSAGGAGAWGLPHWQREHYRCRPSSSFKAIVLILKVVAGFHLNDKTRSLWSVKSAMMPTNKNTVSLNAHERISQNLSTCPPLLGGLPMQRLETSQWRSVSASCSGVMAFMEKEEDCIISCSKNEMCSFYKVQPPELGFISTIRQLPCCCFYNAL